MRGGAQEGFRVWFLEDLQGDLRGPVWGGDWRPRAAYVFRCRHNPAHLEATDCGHGLSAFATLDEALDWGVRVLPKGQGIVGGVRGGGVVADDGFWRCSWMEILGFVVPETAGVWAAEAVVDQVACRYAVPLLSSDGAMPEVSMVGARHEVWQRR